MSCPLSSSQRWTKNYVWFFLLLLLTIGIWLFKLNQPLFYAINNQHAALPVIIWEALNFISYSRFFILPLLLLILTAIFRRDKFIPVVVLILAYYSVFAGLKQLVGEARPYMVLPANSFYWLSKFENAVTSADKSFPSGHTGNMAIFVFTVMALFVPQSTLAKTLLFLLLVMTCLARICTGWHWPVDVLASALIGYLMVKICFGVFKLDPK
jgi:membrane-associated phospholipid phosphatase